MDGPAVTELKPPDANYPVQIEQQPQQVILRDVFVKCDKK